jgi:hypothetical protein
MRGRYAKQVVYRYNGHLSSDQIEFDAHDTLTFTKGDIIWRPGKYWKVESTQLEEVRGDRTPIPSLLVCFVDIPKAMGTRTSSASPCVSVQYRVFGQ